MQDLPSDVLYIFIGMQYMDSTLCAQFFIYIYIICTHNIIQSLFAFIDY